MISKSSDETIALGYKVGSLLKKGMCICLVGDLAGGKTTFTKGIGKALRIREVINSPTFTILKIYKGDLTLYHIDAYRLDGAEYDLGLDEYGEDGIMVVEWPEYYEDYLPSEYLKISFRYIDDDTREIGFEAIGEAYRKIAEEVTC